jgi:protoporphyrin/coproporphyrin ferrochelatase
MSEFRALNYDIDPVFHATNKPIPKVGVLITNLGTPDEPTPKALRRYLGEFLSDKRVIEIPMVVWKCILHGIILRVRPKKSAKLYQSVWTSEGSPLLAISRQQEAALQQQLGDDFSVKLGMRYGNPSIAKALREFQAAGVRKIIVLPLYPQYAAPTTGSTFDAVAKEIAQWRWVPELHFINNYCDEPGYIDALANSIREDIERGGMPQKIIFSYHGTPKRNLDLGDPYFCLCMKTTRLVAEKLGLDKDDYLASFQSRFGYAEWLKPYTDQILTELPAQGVKNVAIVSPAFSADCLETLEELAVENRHTFMEAGGEAYRYIAALNDRPDHIAALSEIIKARHR